MTLYRNAACLTAVSLLALAGPVRAQTAPSTQSRALAPSSGAAATLPNSFESPVRARPVAPAIPVAPAPPAVTPSDVAVAEAALRVVIEQMRAGRIEPSLYTVDLANRLKGQLETIAPMLAGYGAIQTVEAQGAQNGTGQFLVIFDEAATQWLIGLDEDGLIAALLFRPAPAVSSEPVN